MTSAASAVLLALAPFPQGEVPLESRIDRLARLGDRRESGEPVVPDAEVLALEAALARMLSIPAPYEVELRERVAPGRAPGWCASVGPIKDAVTIRARLRDRRHGGEAMRLDATPEGGWVDLGGCLFLARAGGSGFVREQRASRAGALPVDTLPAVLSALEAEVGLALGPSGSLGEARLLGGDARRDLPFALAGITILDGDAKLGAIGRLDLPASCGWGDRSPESKAGGKPAGEPAGEPEGEPGGELAGAAIPLASGRANPSARPSEVVARLRLVRELFPPIESGRIRLTSEPEDGDAILCALLPGRQGEIDPAVGYFHLRVTPIRREGGEPWFDIGTVRVHPRPLSGVLARACAEARQAGGLLLSVLAASGDERRPPCLLAAIADPGALTTAPRAATVLRWKLSADGDLAGEVERFRVLDVRVEEGPIEREWRLPLPDGEVATFRAAKPYFCDVGMEWPPRGSVGGRPAVVIGGLALSPIR